MQKKKRIAALIITDILLISISYFLAFYLRFDLDISERMLNLYTQNIIIITLIKIIIFSYFGIYNSLWKYASIEEMMQVVTTVILANAAVLSYLYISNVHFPRSIYLIVTMLDIMLIGGVRFSYRVLRKMKLDSTYMKANRKRIMVVGAGDAGAMVIKEFKNHMELMRIVPPKN